LQTALQANPLPHQWITIHHSFLLPAQHLLLEPLLSFLNGRQDGPRGNPSLQVSASLCRYLGQGLLHQPSIDNR
jgi:hypothetical protein